MRYRNTKTGVIVDVKSQIIGGNWQVIGPANSSVNDKVAPVQPKRRVTKSKNE